MTKKITVRHFSSYSLHPVSITIDPDRHKTIVDFAYHAACELGFTSYKVATHIYIYILAFCSSR